jgi:hypothetical protein
MNDTLAIGVLREIELTDKDVEEILGHMFVDVTNDPLGLVSEATLPVRRMRPRCLSCAPHQSAARLPAWVTTF